MALGPHRVVIGCDGFDYLIIGLKYDPQTLQVFPEAEFLKRNTDKINAWVKKYDQKTTISTVIDLTVELMKNHGKYNVICNNCITFANAFLQKLQYADIVSGDFDSRQFEEKKSQAYYGGCCGNKYDEVW